MTIRVQVEGTDRAFAANGGDDLLEVFQSNGEPIATSCGGVASCGLCRIHVVAGKQNLVPIRPQELVHLGNVAKVLGLRLACQAQILPISSGEIIVRIPEVDDVEARKRKKAERARLDTRGARARSPSSVRQPAIEWRPGRGSGTQNGPEGKGGT